MDKQLALIYGYLHGMWRYRWSALLIAWIIAVLGWSIVYMMPNHFNAKTVVYVDTSSVLKPLLEGLTPETSTQDDLKIISRVLLSRKNLLTVIRQLDMDLEINSPKEKERLVEKLSKSIKIKGGGTKRDKNNIYEISYQSHSANRAFQMVSKLLDTMIEETLNTSRTDTVSAQQFLDSQIEIYEKRLSEAEEKLALFKKENVGFMPDERGGYYTRLQKAKDDVDKTGSELELANRRYSELTRQLTGESPILSTDYFKSINAKKLKDYQLQLDSLLNQYTELHPKVRELKVIIENMKSNPDSVSDTTDIEANDIKQEFNPVYQELKLELNKASVDIEILKIQLNKQLALVSKLNESIDVIPEVEAKLSKLNRGYEVTRERYLDLVERRESAQLAHNVGNSSSDITFRVIEEPVLPVEPSGPNRVIFLTAVLLAAMGAGLGWSLLRYLLQPTFIDFNQLMSTTSLPILGSINLHLSPQHKKNRRIQLWTFSSGVLLLVILYGFVLVNREISIIRDKSTDIYKSIVKSF